MFLFYYQVDMYIKTAWPNQQQPIYIILKYLTQYPQSRFEFYFEIYVIKLTNNFISTHQ